MFFCRFEMNENCQNPSKPWLHWFAVLTAITTFLLIGLGGLVTSHEAGMSVPDWPTTYGYNMFFFPISKWVGGVFYEHTHRLLASAVGFLTTVLAIWLWAKDPRKWMHWLGVVAFLLVVAQGILGGLRVRENMAVLGIFHGAVGQSFLALTCAIALFTSRRWINFTPRQSDFVPRGLRSHVLWVTVLIFGQLLLGATMRHQHAGLAIHDFPLAYHQIWPNTSADAVARYNAEWSDMVDAQPVTAFQIILQMVHRLVALFIFLGVAAAAGLSVKKLGIRDLLARLALVWAGLIMVQIGLGAWTIWSNKAADIATAHVMVGALSLVLGVVWCLIARRRSPSLTEIATGTTISAAFGTASMPSTNK